MVQTRSQKEEEKRVNKWVIYNFMAIERGLLPEKEKRIFLHFVQRRESVFEKSFSCAMNILEYTNISDKKILDFLYPLPFTDNLISFVLRNKIKN